MLFSGETHSFNYIKFECCVVERIFSKIGITKPENLISICHWALQDFPAPEFFIFKIYDEIYSRCFIDEPKYQVIYDLCRELAIKDGVESRREATIHDLSDIIYILKQNSYANILVGNCLEWYLNVITKNLMQLTDKERYFPVRELKEIYQDYLKDGKCRMLWAVEIPLFTNENGIAFNCCHDSSDSAPVNLAMIFSAIRYLLSNQEHTEIHCNLYESCTLKFKTEQCYSNFKEFCNNRVTSNGDCAFVFALKYLNMFPPKNSNTF